MARDLSRGPKIVLRRVFFSNRTHSAVRLIGYRRTGLKKQLIRILIFSVIATTLVSNQNALATPKKVGRSSDKSVANTILSG